MADRTRAAVLGQPIAHSLSPVLHRAAYAALGLDWTYAALSCGVAELPAVLTRLSADHAGVSLTMPLKLAAVPLVGSLDPLAAAVGAVNTVVFGGQDRADWHGANTDVAGAEAALAELGTPVAGAPVVLLGAGGSARAVVAALGRLGVAQLTICARDTTRVSALVPIGKAFGIACRAAAWTVAPDMVQAASLLVSTVPAAAVASLLPAVQRWPAVFDLIYEGWPTPLGAAAAAFGAPVVGGLPMLVAQAAAAIQLMTGLVPPLDVLRAAGERALAER